MVVDMKNDTASKKKRNNEEINKKEQFKELWEETVLNEE